MVSFFMEGIGIWLRVQWELLMSIPRRSQRWQLRTALFPVLGAAPRSSLVTRHPRPGRLLVFGEGKTGQAANTDPEA